MPVLFGDLDDDPASRDTSVEVCINNQMPSHLASLRAAAARFTALLVSPTTFSKSLVSSSPAGSSIVRRNN